VVYVKTVKVCNDQTWNCIIELPKRFHDTSLNRCELCGLRIQPDDDESVGAAQVFGSFAGIGVNDRKFVNLNLEVFAPKCMILPDTVDKMIEMLLAMLLHFPLFR